MKNKSLPAIALPGTVQINEPFGIVVSNFIFKDGLTPEDKVAAVLRWTMTQLRQASQYPERIHISGGGE